jgi:addiction module HigA family antidote
MTIPKHREPTHPGEIFLTEFLEPKKLTQKDAAGKLGISHNRLNEIILGKRGVTADTALRLAKLTKTAPEFWLQLQNAVDLYRAQRELADVR